MFWNCGFAIAESKKVVRNAFSTKQFSMDTSCRIFVFVIGFREGGCQTSQNLSKLRHIRQHLFMVSTVLQYVIHACGDTSYTFYESSINENEEFGSQNLILDVIGSRKNKPNQ
mmetsp:Transcript_15327/g.23346  ORF Transcript_15327/g.23346 Transcript_15327/m.23346 type:complete len:113 (-) Transcript_15327:640-978(-)